MSTLKGLFGEEDNPIGTEVYAVEKMLVEMQAAIHCAMVGSEISQKELAERLGCTPARVSQYLSSDGKNLKMKTLARIAHALELKVEIRSKKKLERKASPQPWQQFKESHKLEIARGANDNRVVSLYGSLAA